jgi:hypothetical protein
MLNAGLQRGVNVRHARLPAAHSTSMIASCSSVSLCVISGPDQTQTQHMSDTPAGKRYKRVENATALIWKLLTVAEKTFRRLNAPHLLAAVAASAKYVNGKPVHASAKRVAA